MSLFRTFVALKVPSTSELGEVLDWLGRLGPGVRPVRADGLHVTLKFLGETAAGQVEEIAESLRKTASEWNPFELVFRGISQMPIRHPRVIFADLADPDHHVPLVAGPVAEPVPVPVAVRVAGPVARSTGRVPGGRPRRGARAGRGHVVQGQDSPRPRLGRDVRPRL